MTNKKQIKCMYCNSKNAIKKGVRKAKNRIVQKYYCRNCKKYFAEKQDYKQYPIQTILSSISNYNLGYNLIQTSTMTGKKYNTKIPISTISSWLNQYKTTCAFSKLRNWATKQYNPKNIIFKKSLNHIQPYTFKYHNAKLDLSIKINPNFAALKYYIEKINSEEFPHHIFTHHHENIKNNRASQANFKYLDVKISKKENLSSKLAKLALNLATTNKDRHQKIQDFMLINDGATIATEIPTYLTNWDAAYYRNKKGFVFPLNNYQTPITGHIDILQIKNGLLHILDYKPNAHLNRIQEQALQQLTIYAMALSKKLNLPLSDFKCAWFDHNNYFEFFPLHAVCEKQNIMKKENLMIIEK